MPYPTNRKPYCASRIRNRSFRASSSSRLLPLTYRKVLQSQESRKLGRRKIDATQTKQPSWSALEALSNELLYNIYGHLDAVSQICLGLTCKHFGHISQREDFQMTNNDMLELGQREDRIAFLLHDLYDWFPKTYRFCWKCLKYGLAKGQVWIDGGCRYPAYERYTWGRESSLGTAWAWTHA